MLVIILYLLLIQNLNILISFDLKRQNLHKLNNLSDDDRSNKLTYINIMNNNLDYIRQELYQ